MASGMDEENVMLYQIELKPQAIKDGKKIPKTQLQRIFNKIDKLRNNLAGDVKRLTNFSPEYRLRAGSYRVLFETEGEYIVIYRILHRKHAYN
jgi:mRNA interferase RelE/StbE